MTEQLKPCPFCGGKGSVHRPWPSKRLWEAFCHNGEYGKCPINPDTPLYKTRGQAIATWNRRAADKEES